MKKVLIILSVMFLILAGVIGFGLLTTSGAQMLLRPLLARAVGYADVRYDGLSGNLVDGLRLEGLKFTRIKGLPPESILRVQELFVKLNAPRPEGLLVEITNARIRFKQSDPIVMEGRIKDGQYNLNIFGPSLGINEFKEYIYAPDWLRSVSGHIKDFDIFVKGPFRKPQIRGEAFAQELVREKITLIQVPVRFYFNIDAASKPRATGYVFITGGKLLSRRTEVTLKESRIVFEGDMSNPKLNLRGNSVIEDVSINIRITGTRLQPDIQLTSQPPLPREGLLIMLATGKRWQGVEGALATGTLSPEVATDFLDFFFFGGRGQKMGQRFGIKEIDLTLTPDTQGIGVRKAVTDKLDVGYGVERTSAGVDHPGATTQTVGGEYKMTDKISVELEKKTQTPTETNTLESGLNKVESEDKVMLKFETKF